ncbi:MAG: LamG-like jellyroll fold domain-containing protein [bacterium]|nr:LamG-like jellyroll fold domain-containing protein [bacterium]
MTMTEKQNGQSLIEVVVGLAVASVLIGAALVGITFMLRSDALNQKSQTATALSRSLLQNVRSAADANWRGVYNLPKGASYSYLIVASGTTLSAFPGMESVFADAPEEGLRAYWKLDESAGSVVHDFAGGGFRGAVFGAVPGASCRAGGCLSFDGAGDYVTFLDAAGLNLSSALTVSSWILPNTIPTSPDTGIVSKGGLRYALTYDASGEARFYIGDSTNRVQAPVSPGTWHHILGSFDGASPNRLMSLYVDGELVATGTSAFSVTGASGDFLLGRYGSSYFDGLLDDVRVYDRALTPLETQDLYQSGAYTRYFYVEDVLRDLQGDIVVSGGIRDPGTEKVTAVVSWVPQGTSVTTLQVSDYLTRWRNEVFHQSDWSLGAFPLTPVPEPGGGFGDSTNIRFSPGSIRIDKL